MTVVEKSVSSVPVKQSGVRWSYANGTSDVPLLGVTIGDMFDQTVEKYPDHPALIAREQNIRLTYRELQEQVNRCAKALLHLGFQKGERVGIWSPNPTRCATSCKGASKKESSSKEKGEEESTRKTWCQGGQHR